MSRRRQIMRYRWEFMRRSDEYHGAYRRAMELRESGRPLWDDPRIEVSDWRFIYKASDYYREELRIAEPFGLKWMIDPDLPFEQIVEEQERFRMSLDGKSEYVDEFDFRTVEAFGTDATRLTLKIDFDKTMSIEHLLEEVKSMVVAHWSLYVHRKGRPKKKRLTDLDRIILAGDLAKAGWKPAKIAARLVPHLFRRDPEKARLLCRYYCARYRAMISGGWRALDYP